MRTDERTRPRHEARCLRQPRGRVVEQHPLRTELIGNGSGRRISRQVVEAVHQQHWFRTGSDETVDHHAEPRHRCHDVAVGVEAGGREVTLGKLPRPHRRAVGRAPHVERAQRVELGAVAPPVNERVEPEAGEELGELRGMPEGVGDVRDDRDRSERARNRPAEQQVANVGLAARQQRVGLHVPRSGGKPSRTESRNELFATVGSHREVVLEHDRLPVEHETETGIGCDQIEYGVDRVDEPSAEHLERPVPLPIPMEVRNEQDLVRQVETT